MAVPSALNVMAKVSSSPLPQTTPGDHGWIAWDSGIFYKNFGVAPPSACAIRAGGTLLCNEALISLNASSCDAILEAFDWDKTEQSSCPACVEAAMDWIKAWVTLGFKVRC